MASTQRPKFRTTNGCCICRRKSSSSRFAPSSRWERYFDACFKLNGELRSGLICNACVLIVKRYKAYLPSGQDATWSYVVDCRLGPGTKNMSKIKKKMTNGPTSLPYFASEQNSLEITDGSVDEPCDFLDYVPGPIVQGKSRRTTILFSKKMKRMRGPIVAQQRLVYTRKIVSWSDLVVRRVKVPPHVPLFTHPEAEGYHTCCGIIYISPDCGKIWAQAEFFQHCRRLHPVPGKFNGYQESGYPAFAARISELRSEISSQSKFGSTDSASCEDDLESPCTPSTVVSDAGVEVSSDGSARSTASDSLEFSEQDDFCTNPSSPASNVGLFQDEPYDLTVADKTELLSRRQPLTLSAAMSFVVKARIPYEA